MTRRIISDVEVKDVRKTIREWDKYARTKPIGHDFTDPSSEGFPLWCTVTDFLWAWQNFRKGEADKRDQLISHEIAMYLACDNKEDKTPSVAYLRNMFIEAAIRLDKKNQAEAIRLAVQEFDCKEETVKRDYRKYKEKIGESNTKRDRALKAWLKKDSQQTFRDLLMVFIERKKWGVVIREGIFNFIPPYK
ncbi:hypothetical protein [Vibrio parahaemolyticus]|uniref:hypothetical protein n=1 Tax=Vibrio parahaemolyticus TaxID=670 RepID=UPI001E295811|nr:hypothetical protein [Vibrio parahaemolyticus]MDF5366399.1 hypothetical protein [Vibrio parahaemolyticus]HCE1243758.1 hypothetical protein [Vibrio parahaemolyticus]HCG6227659.1 hypothetical protein [Vibrio parahaemolyticus]HCG6951951.1 hypothetical protein [Vibrio parahaemolyticus]HCH0840346.1 hypothetical protein [Vibrio parahaemolyticus]